MRPVVPVVATESRLRALCTRGEVPVLIGAAPITVRMEPLTECNLPGGKARQTSAVTEDDHQLREARSAAHVCPGLRPAVAGLPVADRTRHPGKRPQAGAMPRIYGVTDSPHGSGPLRPPASAGAVAGHYVGLIEFVGGAYDGCHHGRVASMPDGGNGPRATPNRQHPAGRPDGRGQPVEARIAPAAATIHPRFRRAPDH